MKTHYDALLRERADNPEHLPEALREATRALEVCEHLLLAPETDHDEALGMKARDLGKLARLYYLAEDFDAAREHFVASITMFELLKRPRAIFLAELRLTILMAEHGHKKYAYMSFETLRKRIINSPALSFYEPFIHFHRASLALIDSDSALAESEATLAHAYWRRKAAKRMVQILETSFPNLVTK